MLVVSTCVFIFAFVAMLESADVAPFIYARNQAPDRPWCRGCEFEKEAEMLKLYALQDSLFANKNVCGDKVCNVAIGETCATCPGDCGICTYTSPITKCVNKKQIHLTIDNFPITSDTVEQLDSLGVKATFFVNAYKTRYFDGPGEWNNSALANKIRQAYKSGHTIASGTFSYLNLLNAQYDDLTPPRTLPLDEFRKQMLMNDNAVYQLIGKYPVAFCPPYMAYNFTLLNFIESMGYIPITGYPFTRNSDPKTIISNIQKEAFLQNDSGFIVALNKNQAIDKAELLLIVQHLREIGLTFVDLPTCLNKPVSAFFRNAGDNLFSKSPEKLNLSPATTSTTTPATSSSNTVKSTSASSSTLPFPGSTSTSNPSSPGTSSSPSTKVGDVAVKSGAYILSNLMSYAVEIFGMILATIGFI